MAGRSCLESCVSHWLQSRGSRLCGEFDPADGRAFPFLPFWGDCTKGNSAARALPSDARFILTFSLHRTGWALEGRHFSVVRLARSSSYRLHYN
jgi:hypothetical protein